MFQNENLQETPVVDDAAAKQEAIDAIAMVNPDLVLRNLAFWLDVAIARGRMVDANAQKDALSQSQADKEPEI